MMKRSIPQGRRQPSLRGHGGSRLRVLAAFLLMTVLLLTVGCFGWGGGPAEVSSVPAEPEPTTVRLPTSAPAADELFCGAAGLTFALPMVPGDAASDLARTVESTVRLRSAIVTVPDRVFLLKIASGYRVTVCTLGANGVFSRAAAEGNALWYGYVNARVVFVLERIDGTEIAPEEAASLQITLLDPNALTRDAFGLWTAEPVWGAADSFGGTIPLAEGEQICAPVPLSDGGLGVLFGGDETEAVRSFRAAALRLTDDGLMLSEDPALQALLASGAQAAQSLYLPQTADTFAVLILEAGADPSLLTLTGGTARPTDENRLGGLINMNTRLDEIDGRSVLQMIQYSCIPEIPEQEYLGAVLPVADVVSVRCDARFELMATLWALDETGKLKRTKTYWQSVQPGGSAPRGYALLEPDREDDGFLLLCVHRRAEPVVLPSGSFAVKSRGMGAMRGYNEVPEGVVVEYAAGRALQAQGFDDPVVAQNLLDITSESVPYVYAGEFNRWQAPDTYYLYPEMTDVSPVWYSGRNLGNTYVNHVSPRSYLTAAANPNSRFYQFADSTGYGSTCVFFSLSLFGVTETYPVSQLNGTAPLLKFVREPFSYASQAESLRPGDLLMETDPVSLQGHLMVVKEVLRHPDGRLYAASVLESWPPFSRQRTFYFIGATDASCALLRGCLPSNLEEYTLRLRVKPEYVRSLRELYDMSPDITVGTVMCDRGSDALYCIGARLAEFTVTDEAAEQLFVYRNSTLTGRISLAGADRRNGFRVVDFAPLLTDPGLYTVYTDTSSDVQERFFVPAQKTWMYITHQEGDPAKQQDAAVHIVAPDRAEIDSMFVCYRRDVPLTATDPDQSPQFVYEAYPAEMIVAADHDKYGEGAGMLTVPETLDGRRYSYTRVIYRTPYGTYWLGYSDGKLVQSSEYQY